MNKYSIQSLTIFSLILLLFQACTSENRFIPDVSDIDAPLEIQRFEQAMFQMDTLNFKLSLELLAEEYPKFTELFSANILEAGSLKNMNDTQLNYLRGFVTSPVYRAVYDTTQLIFPQLDIVKEELQQTLKLFRYYFPEYSAPIKLTTFTSAFNYSAIIYGDNELAVGLDMFLGPDFNYQQYNPGSTIFSSYLVRSYTPEHLVRDITEVIVNDVIGDQRGNRLLDIIVNNGKRLYILDQLLPLTADTVKFKISDTQWQWLNRNEKKLWAHLLSEDLLYSTDYQEFRKLVDPSPSGAPMLPEESPGQAANYIGFNIVKAFMRIRKDMPLSELLLFEDAQEIMTISKYKPARN